jgi:hypothetical protein
MKEKHTNSEELRKKTLETHKRTVFLCFFPFALLPTYSRNLIKSRTLDSIGNIVVECSYLSKNLIYIDKSLAIYVYEKINILMLKN